MDAPSRRLITCYPAIRLRVYVSTCKRSLNPVWTWERANRTLPLSTASTGRCPLRREGARTGSARCSTVLARLPQRRIPGWPNGYVSVRRSRYAVARPSSSDSDRARFSGRRGVQPGCWTRCAALRGDLAIRAVLSKALRGRKSEKRERPRTKVAEPRRSHWPRRPRWSVCTVLRTPSARPAGPAACPYRLRRTLTRLHLRTAGFVRFNPIANCA